MNSDNELNPDLQAVVACEDVRQEINGMQTLVGVVSGLPVPKLPARLMKLCVWTRWTGGIGKFHQTSRIIAPDDETVIGESSVAFELRELEAHATNVNFFAGLTLGSTGNYTVEVLLDDDLHTRFTIPVIQAGPPKQQ